MIGGMILEVLSDPDGAFASARARPRPAAGLLAAAAASLLGAGFLLLYLRHHLDFRGAAVYAGPLGLVEVTTALLLRVYAWMALMWIVAYPVIFHGVATLLGGEARLSGGLDAHARLTAAAVLVYDAGAAATFSRHLPSLLWQAAFMAWGLRLQSRLARSVYALPGARGALAIAATTALWLLLLASILLTLLSPYARS